MLQQVEILRTGIICLAFVTSAAAAGIPAARAPEPTPFEQMARQRSTEIVSAAEVGGIESSGARAVVTALVIENVHHEPRRRRGVRIDLQNDTSRESLFIAEEELVYRWNELVLQTCLVANSREEASSTTRASGVERCRPSRTAPQSYCPTYIIADGSEYLALSTFKGGNYRFPDVSPSLFADALGRALDEFGIEKRLPARERIGLPDDVLEAVTAAAVRSFPELASSPGVKAADYSVRDMKTAAYAIFRPYAREGDYGHALSVSCEQADEDANWECKRSRPRGYLTMPGQELDLVIIGAMNRKQALALVEFVRTTLDRKPEYADVERWNFISVHTPWQHEDTLLVRVTDGADLDVSLEAVDAEAGDDARFELLGITDNSSSGCGYRT